MVKQKVTDELEKKHAELQSLHLKNRKGELKEQHLIKKVRKEIARLLTANNNAKGEN